MIYFYFFPTKVTEVHIEEVSEMDEQNVDRIGK